MKASARRLSRTAQAAVVAATLVACMQTQPARADASGELDDAVARVQYAYYTGDPRSLEVAAALIDKLEVPQNLALSRDYYATYSRWKLAQVYADAAAQSGGDKAQARSAASKAAQGCIQHADALIKTNPRLAEVYAMQAACAGAMQAPGSCAHHKALRTALELEPANPRVKLIDALCSSGGDTRTSAAVFQKLRDVVTAFDSAPVARPGNPDWGQPEALVLMGQVQLQRGDTLAARDAIEKALVLAPDYRKAQELLQAAAARPH